MTGKKICLRSIFNHSLIVLILYIYIYNPVLKWMGFGFVAVLMPVSLLLFFININKLSRYIGLYRKEFLLSIFIIFYLIITYLLNGTDPTDIIFNLAKSFIANVFVSIIIVRYLLSRIDDFAFLNTIVFVGFIASVISCLALLNPSINDFLRNIQLDVESDIGLLEKQLGFRSFGFSSFLVSAYGYVQGIIAAYCIIMLDKHHKYYLLFIITIFVSVIINARTGVFPILLAILYVVFKSIRSLNLKNILLFCFFISFIYISIYNVLSANQDTLQFVLDFIEQLDNIFVEGNAEDTPYIRMLKIPETVGGIFFGEGRSLFYETAGENSDIGYVNQLYMGGIVFLTMLLLLEYWIYSDIKKRTDNSLFPTIFFISILLFNYKGVPMYGSNPFLRLWFLYYFVLAHNVISPRKIKIS